VPRTGSPRSQQTISSEMTEQVAEVVAQCPALAHLNLSSKMTSVMQEQMTSVMQDQEQEQEGFQQCWRITKLCFTLISDGILNGADRAVRLATTF
jgi:hypothetical protein